MPKKTAVILVNYKDYAKRFLEECRDSLRMQNYPKDLYSVYIVDNASSEETKKYLSEIYPESVIIPRPDGNYAAANNAGIKQGIADGCEYFVIANMDTKFDQEWLSELVKAIESDKKIGIAQSKMLLYPRTEEEWKKPKINSLGNIMNYLGFGFTSHYNEEDRPLEGLPEIKGYASGCSFIIKKEVVEKIKGYNEEFFMYHDDIEMSWKTKLAGYKIVLAPKSVMYHKYEFGRSIMMLYYMERNRYITVFSFYSIPTLILILPALIAMDLGILLYSIPGGWLKTKLKVYGYFFTKRCWKNILEARAEIKKFKVVNDHEIVRSFFGKVVFQEIDNPVLKYIANPIFNLYWLLAKEMIIW